MAFDRLFAGSNPILPRRGLHFDLKGLPPTPERMMSLLPLIHAARFNVLLMEWEDMFPWTVDRRFCSPTAYGEDFIRRFCDAARKLHIEIIPLVQCLGHMETPLSVPGHEHLRDAPDSPSTLNALADGARELVERMVEDVLRVLPEVQYFHLGGDEARDMGTRSETRDFIEEHGAKALYLQHVEPTLDKLIAKGIRPILWHDMMIHWDDEALQRLAAKSDLMVWGYKEHPDETDKHYSTKYIQRFHESGFKLWGATAYKGGDGHNGDLPNLKMREDNALAWADVAQRFRCEGVIVTGWSRYSTNRVQHGPIDSVLHSLLNAAVILHDGRKPDGGIEACIEALAELDEKERFLRCRAAMENLSAVRERSWKAIQSLMEVIVLREREPRRASGAYFKTPEMKHLRHCVKETESVETEVRESLKGLIDEMWIDEYLDTRLTPIRQELVRLSSAEFCGGEIVTAEEQGSAVDED